MKKILLFMSVLTITFTLTFVCSGCSKITDNEAPDSKMAVEDDKISGTVYQQSQLKEPTELSLSEVSEDGTITLEIDTLAKPDSAGADEKGVFLAVKTTEDTDVPLRYTYDTDGKEGLMLCCAVNDSDEDESLLKPIYAMRLAQFSAKNYGEIWLSGGTVLKKGTNLFYLCAGDQSLPCRMMLQLTFLKPEQVENIVLYPPEN